MDGRRRKIAQSYEHLLVEAQDDGVGLITINRPQKLNAMAIQTRVEMAAALRELGSDKRIGAIVITGAGERGFCAGMDMSDTQQFTPGDPSGGARFSEAYHIILELEKPIVAAINGYAVGAGLQLAAFCDVRVASENARFGMAEIDEGIPCITGIYVLWDLVGRGRTAEVILSGRMLSAQEAFQWGIVSRVVPKEQLLSIGIEMGRHLARKPRTAMRMNREWMRRLLGPGYEQTEKFGRYAQAEAVQSGEMQKGMDNFLSKRREGRST